MPAREPRVGVARGHGLSLLGEAQPPPHRLGRLGEHGPVGGTAAPAHRAPPPVEEGEGHPALQAERGHGALGEMQLPVRGHVSRLLVGVAVADHDRLAAAPRLEVPPVRGMGEEDVEGGARSVQVLDRLEERHQVQPVGHPRVTGEQQHREEVARTSGHADDVRLDRLRPHPLVGPMDEPEELHRLVRRRREVEVGRRERPIPEELGGQHGLASRLVAARIVGGDVVPAEDLGEGFRMASGVLAEVERGEVGPEDLGLGDEGAEPPPRQTGPAVTAEARLDEPEVGDELLPRGVGVRARAVVGPPRPARRFQRRLEATVDERHFLAVGLAAVALAVPPRLVGEEPSVALEALEEGLVDSPILRHAEVAVRSLERAAVQPQDRRLVLAQRLLRHRRGDVGISVPIPPDPAPEAEKVRHRERLAGPGPVEGPAEVGLHLGDEVEQRALDVVETAPHLVEDGRARVAGLLRLPERDDHLPQGLDLRLRLAGGQDPGVEAVEGLGHLRELEEHGAALGLGGVGGEDGHHEEPGDEGADLVGTDPLLLEGEEGGGDRLLHGPARGLGAVGPTAQDADPLLLLGEVDEGEVGRERLHHPARLGEGQQFDPREQTLARRGVAAPMRLGQAAHLFDEIEEGPALLLDERRSEEVPELVDLLAEAVTAFGHGHDLSCLAGEQGDRPRSGRPIPERTRPVRVWRCGVSEAPRAAGPEARPDGRGPGARLHERDMDFPPDQLGGAPRSRTPPTEASDRLRSSAKTSPTTPRLANITMLAV